MKASRWIALAVVALGSSAARGDLVPVTMFYYTHVDKTAVFGVDLTGFNIGTIRSVTVTDGNVQRGTGEIFSGFDLDFLVFDRDGDLATTDDQIVPLRGMSFVVPGDARPAPNGKDYYPSPPDLFGLDVDGNLDEDKATLETLDANYDVDLARNLLDVPSASGWVSLGDDGMILAGFPLVSIGSSEPMFLFAGEVGPPPMPGEDPDELSTATVEIQAFAVGLPYVPGIELGQGQSVNLDGAGPSDVTTWLWDLDGDGEYDDAVGPMLGLSFDDLFLLFDVDLGPHTIRLRRLTGSGEEAPPIEFDIQLVPDPATWALLLAVGCPIVLRRRRRRV